LEVDYRIISSILNFCGDSRSIVFSAFVAVGGIDGFLLRISHERKQQSSVYFKSIKMPKKYIKKIFQQYFKNIKRPKK